MSPTFSRFILGASLKMMLNYASFMLEDSLGMMSPGSALAKGTAASENSGHQGISIRIGKVKVMKYS